MLDLAGHVFVTSGLGEWGRASLPLLDLGVGGNYLPAPLILRPEQIHCKS